MFSSSSASLASRQKRCPQTSVRTDRKTVTRRDFVLSSAAALVGARQALSAKVVPPIAPAAVSGDDRRFLEDYARRCFRYFWEQTNDEPA